MADEVIPQCNKPTTVVPINATVSTDVGSVFRSSGFLDFYVNGTILGELSCYEKAISCRNMQVDLK